MPKSWSLGRSSSQQKLKAEKEKKKEEDHVKRTGFKITRSRPSSMLSVEFPSSSTISHEGGELEKREELRKPDGSRPNSFYEHEHSSGSALNLLSATQQRDLARRERKDSAASSASSLADTSTNGDSSSSKYVNPSTPSRKHLSTNNNSLPSLMKSPSRMSAFSSTATDTTYISATPHSGEKEKIQSRTPLKEKDLATGSTNDTEQKDGHSTKRTLKDMTNQSESNSSNKTKSKESNVHQSRWQDKRTNSPVTAINSLSQFQRISPSKAGRSSINKSLGSTQHASLVVTSPNHSQNRFEEQPISRPDKQTYPYVIRLKTKATDLNSSSPSRYRTRSKDSNAKQPQGLARYELFYISKRDVYSTYSIQPQNQQSYQYQYGLVGLPIPSLFATDRLAAWAVERAARLASSFIYLFGT